MCSWKIDNSNGSPSNLIAGISESRSFLISDFGGGWANDSSRTTTGAGAAAGPPESATAPRASIGCLKSSPCDALPTASGQPPHRAGASCRTPAGRDIHRAASPDGAAAGPPGAAIRGIAHDAATRGFAPGGATTISCAGTLVEYQE